MTGYVATRWYRAPEIMLNWMHYNQTGGGSPTRAACGGGRAGPEARTSGTGQALKTRPSERQGTTGPGLTLALPRVLSGRGLDVTVGPVGPAPGSLGRDLGWAD